MTQAVSRRLASYGALAALAAPSVFIVLRASVNLRPIADDYCIAAVATRGLLPSILHWFTTWSGDLVVWGSNTILVGIPLVHFPWQVGSGIALLISSTAIALSAALSIYAFTTRSFLHSFPNEGKAVLVVQILVGLSAWWTFWWLPASTVTYEDAAPLAEAVLHWQNINAAYVFPVAVLAILGTFAFLAGKARSQLLLSFIVGLIAGFSGPVIASSIALGSIAVVAGRWVIGGGLPRSLVVSFSLVILGSTAGALISLLSPGTSSRRFKLEGATYRDSLSGSEELNFVSPEFLTQWWDGVFNLGTLYCFVIFCLLGIAMGFGRSLPPSRLASLGIATLVISLVMSLMNRISELFVYQAYWHRVGLLALVFLSACFLGTAVGIRLSQWKTAASGFLLVLLPLSLLPLSLVGVSALEDSAQARLLSWNNGPAPTSRIGDLEGESGWIKCWIALIELKDDPGRSIGPNGVEPPIPY